MNIVRPFRNLLGNTTLARAIRLHRHEKYFKSTAGYAAHRGVYKTFSEASASAPANRNVGDHSIEYLDRIARVFPYDYPVLYWMHTFIDTITTVLDIGGNIGVHFWAYKAYLTYPSTFRWQVIEVPDVVALGVARSSELGDSRLAFSSSFLSIKRPDFVLAAGSVQYIESPRFADIISRFDVKPRYLIINKIPLYDGEEFVTLQNGGSSYHPYRVFNRRDFIDSIVTIGYILRDSWIIPERNFWLPCDSARSFGPSSGLFFQLKVNPD